MRGVRGVRERGLGGWKEEGVEGTSSGVYIVARVVGCDMTI